MSRRTAAALLATTVLAVTSGCATLDDARASKGSGTFRVFPVEKEAVWQALPGVLKELDVKLVEENRERGYLLATNGWSGFSYGERVAVFVDPSRETTGTRVEVVSKRVLATTVLGPNWELPILDKLGERLRATPPPLAPAPPPVVPGS